jgi:enamine deaminase RidA (YjgF/YER057c/UK114 family)
MTAEERVQELGLDLALPPAPLANYIPAVQTGNLVFLSGQVPVLPDGTRLRGKVGAELDVDEAKQAARLCATGLLARLRAHVGSLDRVHRVVKVTGFVNAVPDFEQQPMVINGASDLFVEVFGENGRHARSAVGVGSLPFNVPVEVEAIFEVET